MSASDPVTPLHPPAPVAAVQGTLALDLAPRHDPPEPAPPGAVPGDDLVGVDVRTRRRLEQWAHTYVQVACDVVDGLRPATQLLRWSSSEVYADLARRAHLVSRSGRHQPGARLEARVRPRVAGVRPCFLDADTVEVAVRVQYGCRFRALAARFEVRQQHWTCVALDFA